jgi:hypothetical protein
MDREKQKNNRAIQFSVETDNSNRRGRRRIAEDFITLCVPLCPLRLFRF